MGYTISWEQLPFSDVTYSNVCKIIPTLVKVKFRLEHWGFVIGDNDDQCFCIERYPTQMTFCKTNRDPYTKDAMMALIVMFEYGAAKDLQHDDIDMTWYLDALETVHAVKPLASYEMQKAYFQSWHMKERV